MCHGDYLSVNLYIDYDPQIYTLLYKKATSQGERQHFVIRSLATTLLSESTLAIFKVISK